MDMHAFARALFRCCSWGITPSRRDAGLQATAADLHAAPSPKASDHRGSH